MFIWDGLSLPAGTDVVISMAAMHLSSKYFKDPLRFEPDRFKDEGKNELAFMPFSLGPRNCIGNAHDDIMRGIT